MSATSSMPGEIPTDQSGRGPVSGRAGKGRHVFGCDPEQETHERGWRGPQRMNPTTGELETMELSHEPTPLREGGTDVVPRWSDEHAAVDPHRRLKKGK